METSPVLLFVLHDGLALGFHARRISLVVRRLQGCGRACDCDYRWIRRREVGISRHRVRDLLGATE